MNKIKVMTIVGTRPEIIRLSIIIKIFDKHFNHILVHTGQNYDYELNDIFFQQLEIRKPDYYLKINNTSFGHAIGDTIIKTEDILLKEKPNAILILGDTNSSLAAIVAKRMHIPIYHMEAGNRCFDFNVPEEINRRIVDHIADFNLVYTDRARSHLLSEGLEHRRIYLTGSPMNEVIQNYLNQISESEILNEYNLQPKKYFVVSSHREENIDNKKNLHSLLEILHYLIQIYNYPILFSCHPRTRKKLNEIGYTKNDLLIIHKPFGYFDYMKLQSKSYCTLSDSGTISEESAILKFPAITIRNSMERPEAMDAGSIIITGFDKKIILKSIEIITDNNYCDSIPYEYNINNTSQRVLKIILGTNQLSNYWYNIATNEL